MNDLVIVRPGSTRDGLHHGWEAWEDEQVCPLFPKRIDAIHYVLFRCNSGQRELEVHDAAGTVVRQLTGPEAKVLAAEQSDRDWEAVQGRVDAAYARSRKKV